MATEMRNRPALATQLSLTAEPALEVAPGEALSLRCGVYNGSTAPIAGATLLLLLPPEFDTDDSRCVIALEPLAPNAETTIVRAVHVHPSTHDGVKLRFEFLLLFGDGQLQRSKPATIAVCGRPCLSGPATCTNVMLTDEPSVVTVSASIVNAGSVSAYDVIVDLPAPTGTQALDGFMESGYRWASLAAGASQTVTYRARIVVPTLHRVCVRGASVSDRAAGRVALASSPPLALHPAFTEPQIHCEPGRRHLRVTITGTNAGPGCANAAGVVLRWPRGFVARAHSLMWNGVPVLQNDCPDTFASARLSGDGAQLTIAAIDAGERYEFGCDLEASSEAESGIVSFAISCAGSECNARARCEWSPRTEIRLRLAEPPDRAAAGSPTTFAFEVVNAGDADVTFRLVTAGVDMQCVINDAPVSAVDWLTIASGHMQRVSALVTVPADACRGDRLTAVVSACDAVSELARMATTIEVSESSGPKMFREPVRTAPSGGPTNDTTGGKTLVVTLVEPLDGLRLESWLHVLQSRAGSGGLLRHLRALHVLLPNGASGSNDLIATRLAATSQALALTIDRLAIVSRLPDYRLVFDEIADAALCDATADLCTTLATTPDLQADRVLMGLRCVHETNREAARAAATRIAGGHRGITVVQALCALLPTSVPECPAVSVSLAEYVRSFEATFAELGHEPQRSMPIDAAPFRALDMAADAFIVACRKMRTAMNG